jgi:hypothetical protein
MSPALAGRMGGESLILKCKLFHAPGNNFVLSHRIKQALINMNSNRIPHWKIIPHSDIMEGK